MPFLWLWLQAAAHAEAVSVGHIRCPCLYALPHGPQRCEDRPSHSWRAPGARGQAADDAQNKHGGRGLQWRLHGGEDVQRWAMLVLWCWSHGA
jgi:hypothetical protein